jgi:hypothetical protein
VRGRRLISFAGAAIALEHEGVAASSVVRFLFADVDDAASIEASTALELRPAATKGMLRLTEAGTVLNHCDTPGRIAGQIACEAASRLAEWSRGGVLLHAGAVAWGRQAALLPGASGSGKTTLAAHLVKNGLAYLSDELAFVPIDSLAVQGFARPLSLKPGAWPELEDELIATGEGDGALASADGWLVRPGRLNRVTTICRPELRAIVFPRREPGAAGEVRRLTKAEAALALLANLVNARNLPEHGLPEVTRLAQAVPAYSAVYEEAKTVVPAVRALLSQGARY